MEGIEEFGLDVSGLLAEMAALYAREDGDSGPALMPLGGIGRQEGERVVDLDAPLLGHATREIRDLLKRGTPYGLGVRDAQRAVHLDRDRCLVLLATAVEAGYLTAPEDLHEPQRCYNCQTDDCEYHDHRTWTLTPAGRSLAHASGRKPSTRKNADALVAKVVKAAQAINDAPDALWWVKEIRAVGKYAEDDQEQLLHVDLAVDLRPLLDDPTEQRKAEQRLRDAARDRGERERVWDMAGYGHWRTRLALTGRSKVVRLFRPAEGLDGPVLFREERDLTVPAVPSAPYRRPAEAPVEGCSWCGRAAPSVRVAQRGSALASSPVALCEQCLSLGWTDGLQYQGSAQVWAWPVVRDLRGSLPQSPFHETGCALCGREDAVEQPWWPGDDRDGSGGDGREPIVLRLCTICPGLLELVDAPGHEGWWCVRHQAACLTGMHALLRRRAGVEEVPVTRKARKAPRLTPLHQDVLARLGEHGALSAWDLARAPFSQDHQDYRWWQVRLAHLFDHRLITPVRNGTAEDRELVRTTSEAERDLAVRLRALHRPGPVWDGERVVEPAPPAGWAELRDQAEQAAALLDQEALQRREDHPVPEAVRGRWG
ncbi:hypothetical protein ACFC6U_03030 [Kitasatospora purpeofusca]|uniref:hypothetical protein n=1 Tax=Kitasatospora purpeofusca TaxID=67352 RepID=UPI0035D78CE4